MTEKKRKIEAWVPKGLDPLIQDLRDQLGSDGVERIKRETTESLAAAMKETERKRFLKGLDEAIKDIRRQIDAELWEERTGPESGARAAPELASPQIDPREPRFHGQERRSSERGSQRPLPLINLTIKEADVKSKKLYPPRRSAPIQPGPGEQKGGSWAVGLFLLTVALGCLSLGVGILVDPWAGAGAFVVGVALLALHAIQKGGGNDGRI